MRIGVLGFGTVASATVDSFVSNRDLIRSKTSTNIDVVRVATRTPARAEGRVPAGCEISDDCWDVVNDDSIDVVIELTGDVAFGKELILGALSSGKHVITANKALLARHGDEILAHAEKAARSVLFEGAVAVSIPIIKTLKESAAANRVSSIVGILNGTSNYVLSQMSEQGVDFADAVRDAQGKGYAEADPTLDVDGEDAAHKISLLAALAFGFPIDFDAVEFSGISDVELIDIEFAQRFGYQMKLIAHARLVEGRLDVGVEPTLVENRSMLAQVRGSMNGIALHGDLLGSAFLYGSGAGGVQTASAVLADVLELANRGSGGGPADLGFQRGKTTLPEYVPALDRTRAFYIRVQLDDRTGSLAEVGAVLAGAGVSVSVLHQDRSRDGVTDLIIATHTISTEQLGQVLPLLRNVAGPGHSVVVHPILDAEIAP
ncbi:homoserine dehydrogenase [Rhodococcoides yunnanense]|uniref:homoserine dehydrogenase n=1 Tax=Rhodococcoides yunnanense TaxID=278209 RepID=UPI00093506D3|nr:homoserine dehydrogenase [Rhodococcus yunnanensis]